MKIILLIYKYDGSTDIVRAYREEDRKHAESDLDLMKEYSLTGSWLLKDKEVESYEETKKEQKPKITFSRELKP